MSSSGISSPVHTETATKTGEVESLSSSPSINPDLVNNISNNDETDPVPTENEQSAIRENSSDLDTNLPTLVKGEYSKNSFPSLAYLVDPQHSFLSPLRALDMYFALRILQSIYIFYCLIKR